MDPLSDVLSLLKPQSYLSAGFDAAGAWCVEFPARPDVIKFNAVISGACWLSVDGIAEPVRVTAGDCFLLPSVRSTRLGTSLAAPAMDAATLFGPVKGRGGVAVHNGGGEFYSVGGFFTLAGEYASILLTALPPVVHIRKESEQASLRWAVEQMMREQREGQPGGILIAQHLAHIVLAQALRLHLSEETNRGVGWLHALADKQMSAAIGAMHENPSHRWSLQELAERVGMSRSSFAERFKETVGASPMEYLTRWRMLLAGDRLVAANEQVAAIAFSLGYESESAFSTAFKRVMGCSPRQYARRRNAEALPTAAE
jgi:AraC-like DNA-binding protein